ncbi:MAG: hypothetical protein ABEJ65_00960 [bacterium]
MSQGISSIAGGSQTSIRSTSGGQSSNQGADVDVSQETTDVKETIQNIELSVELLGGGRGQNVDKLA